MRVCHVYLVKEVRVLSNLNAKCIFFSETKGPIFTLDHGSNLLKLALPILNTSTQEKTHYVLSKKLS